MADEKLTTQDDLTDDTDGHVMKFKMAPEEAQDAEGHMVASKRISPAGAEDDEVEGHQLGTRPILPPR